jgi:N utilization substance protein B
MAAVQLLYGMDSHPEAARAALAEELDAWIGRHQALLPGDTPAAARQLSRELVQGVLADLASIDELLDRASTRWRVVRMSQVDRNVLRVAVFELTGRPDVPPPVVLDEAIEIAKQLGSDESGAFVNGVLNRVLELLEQG